MNTLATVERVLRELPDEVREALATTKIVVLDKPGLEHRDIGIGLDWAGAYVASEQRPYVDEEPTCGWIYLFTGNIDPLDEERVELVLLHEIAHVLGMDEHDVHAIGLGHEALQR